MFERKVGSTTKPIPFLMISNIGHISGALNLSPNVWLSKNCQPFQPAQGLVHEIGLGWYYLDGNADDRDTLGSLILHATADTADMTDKEGKIVSYDPFTTQNSDSDEINVLTQIVQKLEQIYSAGVVFINDSVPTQHQIT